MLILQHWPRGQVLEPGEELEECEIDLGDSPPLNWRDVTNDCGNEYGCFIVSTAS
jgi:hypothetical protein